ncbi:MAG: hypothetical protein AB7S70_15555 [Hyphomicrobium sp.]|uniref:hypothetical protein n=1 Tax=Hyphomicrobium sp. TaxID=82 RepID=UPI003D137AD0
MTRRPSASRLFLLRPAPAAPLLCLIALAAAHAQERGEGVVREELVPSAAYEERGRGVTREELDPVMAGDGSGLPHELWSGFSAEALAEAISVLELPPRSPTLFALWRRLMSATAPPATGAERARFTALRIEALDQSGLVDEVAELLAKDPDADRDPVLSALKAKNEIELGNFERGCEIAKGLGAANASVPAPIRSDIALIGAACAAQRGDMASAALQAGLLRELEPGLTGADFLDAVAGGIAPEIPAGAKLSLLDYRIAALGGPLDAQKLIAAASPALLAGLAHDPRVPADLRLAAGEAAAGLNLLSAEDLAPLYRAGGAGADGGSIERASLFKSAEAERSPLRKARFIRGFLDEAKRAGLYGPALRLMAGPTRDVTPVAEIGWFAETAIEVAIASGNYDGARMWASFGASPYAPSADGAEALAHWVALADLADPARTSDHARSLAAVEALAARGRMDSELLHRLATVLDALAITVPIPLWDLASRSPQPAGGYLPDTGVLSELADAAKKKQFGRTVLLVLRSIGPKGAEGAHMIALGDSVRALKRAGLAAEARQLAVEGLFAAWPRLVSQ